jgi:DNA-binding IclR family transcriptional regulator
VNPGLFLRFLGLLSEEARPLDAKAIAVALNISYATALRTINSLVKEGFLLQEPRGQRVSPSDRLFSLARQLTSNNWLWSRRREILNRLASCVQATCNFTICSGDQVVYVDRVELNWPLPLTFKPGSKVPLFCTSSGKFYLAHMPIRKRRKYLDTLTLHSYTPNSVVDIETLSSELISIRKQGFALDDEGFLRGLISVAVPVFGKRRSIIGTLSLHAASRYMDLEGAKAKIPLLRAAAANIRDLYLSGISDGSKSTLEDW